MRKVVAVLLLPLSACTGDTEAGRQPAPPVVVSAVPAGEAPVLPAGYAAAPAAQGLVDPRAVLFDAEGRPLIVEGEPARLVRLEGDGQLVPIATGGGNGPWTGATRIGPTVFVAEAGGPLGGRVLRIGPDGAITVAADGLPRGGMLGPLEAGPDGALYLGVGTAALSASDKRARDVPCQDIRLQTGDRIEGAVPCTGSVLRIDPATREVAVHAWGFADPVALAFTPKGDLLVADDLPEQVTARPQIAVQDVIWRAVPGVWYGWPDYLGQVASADPLLAVHPNPPPPPVASLNGEVRAATVAQRPEFGGDAQAFVAMRDDQGGLVAFTTLDSGVTQAFAANLDRPTAVAFAPHGDALWIADAGTGRLWRVAAQPMP